jgi:hypothetical protein
MTEQRKPFWAKCPTCAHCWPAAYAPLEVEIFARLVKKAACPMCGETKHIGVARQDQGKLLEGCPPPQPGEIADVGARLAAWSASGDTGVSSKAIAAQMTGAENSGWLCWEHPHDPDDLGRCLRLLALFPEWRVRIGEMAARGPGWAGLAARWDEIAAAMAEEVGIAWEKGTAAAKTYTLMRDAIAAGYRADPNYECTFDGRGHLRSASKKNAA